jgi:hypothetical protein
MRLGHRDSNEVDGRLWSADARGMGALLVLKDNLVLTYILD